jgi:hypothetical protein
MNPLLGAALIGAGGNFLGGLFGGDKEAKLPRTPEDLRGQRRNVIGLQNYLLGFNQPGQPWSPQQPQQQPQQQGGSGQPGAAPGQGGSPWPGVNAGMGGGQSPWGGVNQGMSATPAPMGQPNTGPGMPQGGFADTVRSMVGQMGGGPSPILQQATGGMQTQQFNGPMANGLQWVGGTTPVLQGQGIPSQAGNFSNPNYGMQPGGGFSSQMPQMQASNPMLGRMESYFGPLGTPTTALQQQSLGGISQFLNSNPYGQSNTALQGIMGGQGYGEANQAYRNIGNTNFGGAASGAFGQAGDQFGQVGNANYFGGAQGAFNRLENYNPFGAAQGSMEQILASNPGMQGMEALRPLLDRNLAAANQEGGRFGSANAILRSRAVDDNNMLAAQMYQRGVDQQIGAAGQYGQMGNSLINARNMAGQGMLGVGQGRLSQGLGAAQGMLGVGQGQLGVGQLGLQGALGSAGGLGELAMALQGNRLNAAGQMATNQNALFGNMTSAYDTGHRQAAQEAERQQQALAILLSQLGVAEQSSLQGRG